MRRAMTMSAPVAAVFVAVGLTVAPAASSADGPRPVTAFAASLGPGGERPAPNGVKTGAGGLVRAIVTQSGANSTISWSLTFAHLTGPALSAHVYLGKPGEPGASALSLCQPCRTGQRGNASLSVGVAT